MDEWIKSGDRERAARALCFEKCSAGEFLDPENGCVSVCKSADECQGWRAFVHEVSRHRCPSCVGKGVIDYGYTCLQCGGSGEVDCEGFTV